MPRWAYTIAGGALGGIVIWMIASRAINSQFTRGVASLDRQLLEGGGELETRLAAGRRELRLQVQEQIAAEIPPTVENEVRRTLAQHGITPQTGHEIARLAAASDVLLTLALEAQRGAQRSFS